MTFAPSRILFFGSILLPYLLDLIPPHSGGSHAIGTLLWDFVALIVLAISSLFLAFGTRPLRSNGEGLIYLLIAPTAVALYFYSLDTRIKMREQAEFYLRRPELEAHINQLNRGLLAVYSLQFTHHSLPEENTWYDKLPSGIVLCTTEGQPSQYYAGYAYSPEDKQISKSELAGFSGEFYEWRKIDGHWYKWARRDG